MLEEDFTLSQTQFNRFIVLVSVRFNELVALYVHLMCTFIFFHILYKTEEVLCTDPQ